MAACGRDAELGSARTTRCAPDGNCQRGIAAGAGTKCLLGISSNVQVDHDGRCSRLAAAPNGRLEVLAPTHAMDLSQQRQADSLARPLRRRADRMPRPARVRIRRRKPCLRARRRLLGWYVRLLIIPHKSLGGLGDRLANGTGPSGVGQTDAPAPPAVTRFARHAER